jgi:predicted nuclease with TOPRIM domain
MLMSVMVPREKWTDERLDDLSGKVDRGFADTKAEMREGFARVDADIRELRGEIKDLRGEMSSRFDSIDRRFDTLNRNLLAGAAAVIAALIGSNAF